jgi:hypothetical protein
LNGCAENIVYELSLLHLAVLVFGAWDTEKEQLPSSFLFLCDKFFISSVLCLARYSGFNDHAILVRYRSNMLFEKG